MDRYLDEQMFRFNNRIGMNDGTRFQKALAQVSGKRLTWVELTGKESPKAGLRLALFGGVGVSRMRRRLLAFGLSELILDLFWRDGEDGSQSLRELFMLRVRLWLHHLFT